MKLAIITNPNAGRARRSPGADVFRDALTPLGIEVTIHVTAARGDAVRLAKKLATEVDVLGVMGGDGTIHEVVNGLMPDPLPIVVIPFGAGNDLSSIVACPTSPHELAAVLTDGYGAAIDVIDFGIRYCVNSAGLGFEGLVNRYSQDITRVRGHTRYLVALIKAFGSFTCPYFEIITSSGDEIRGEKLFVSIGNGNRSGGAFYLTPDAFPDDGLIDVCIADPLGRVKMLRLLPMSFSGKHTVRPEIHMLQTESLTIVSDTPYPMHIDGEYIDAPPERREIKIVPRALRILCKRDANCRLKNRPKKIL